MKKISEVCGAGKNATSPLYSETTKTEFFDEKRPQISKNKEYYKGAYKGYASIYNVTILKSFNRELQFKDTKYAIKYN